MPKNKTQGIIFGIIMSYSMAVGMEIYNNAIQQGVHLQPGGFTNLTYGIVGKALVEALFMGLIVIIVSALWGNRLGARLPPHPLPTGPAESCSNKRALPRRGSALAYITGTNSTFRSTISLTPSSRAPWSYCHTSKR